MFTRSCLKASLLIERARFSNTFRQRHLLVLGIESSCDDTGAAIVDSSGNILADECQSQLKVHLNNGGIIPPLARDLHVKCIDDVVCSTLDTAKVKIEDIDAIAVTTKPGLPLSLAVGVNYAQKLAIHFRKPLIPVHHMEAHATIGMLPSISPSVPVNFPFVTLLISGGHSQIAFARSLNEFYTLGETIDDAPGEMMDKIARRLKLKNLGHPFDSISGGAAIELLAEKGNPLAFGRLSTTVPMSKIRSCDFSFSGFKRFIHTIQVCEEESNIQADQVIPQAADLAASLQLLTTIHLLKRLSRAFKFIEQNQLHLMSRDELVKLSIDKKVNRTKDLSDDSPDTREIKLPLIVSGGVASSHFITSAIRRFCHAYEGESSKFVANVVVPRPKKLCCDNGIMIAMNGMLKLLECVTGSLQFTENLANDIKGTNGRASAKIKVPHAYDHPKKCARVTGDSAPKYELKDTTTITHIHEDEAHCKCMNLIASNVEQADHVNESSSSIVCAPILTSEDEILSLSPEPRARLGISLREAVVAANIKPDPIKVSLVLGEREHRG